MESHMNWKPKVESEADYFHATQSSPMCQSFVTFVIVCSTLSLEQFKRNICVCVWFANICKPSTLALEVLRFEKVHVKLTSKWVFSHFRHACILHGILRCLVQLAAKVRGMWNAEKKFCAVTKVNRIKGHLARGCLHVPYARHTTINLSVAHTSRRLLVLVVGMLQQWAVFECREARMVLLWAVMWRPRPQLADTFSLSRQLSDVLWVCIRHIWEQCSGSVFFFFFFLNLCCSRPREQLEWSA